MNLTIDCNSAKPQFGMAFRVPNKSDETTKFLQYVGFTKSSACRKGLQQFMKEQGRLNMYDTEYIPATNTVRVIERATGKVMEDFSHYGNDLTDLNQFGSVSYPGRKVIAYLFNPKRFLPRNMFNAGEEAKALERAALREQEALSQFEKIQ